MNAIFTVKNGTHTELLMQNRIPKNIWKNKPFLFVITRLEWKQIKDIKVSQRECHIFFMENWEWSKKYGRRNKFQ